MELTAEKRTIELKSLIKKARREGKIPATIYGRGQESVPLLVDGREFQKLLTGVEKDFLSTLKIRLKIEGKEKHVIIKEIQYHPTTYAILHIDFQHLGQTPINVNVPLKCTHAADCAGIKLGGVLRQVMRKVKVRCLPKDLPKSFEIDVRPLKLHDKRKLKDLSFGDVRPLTDLNQVVVVISKR